MLRFSLMRANKVVVKCTFMSLSRGMFILISFLYANRFGHFPPKPSGGSMFFSISYISEYNILPLQIGTPLAKNRIFSWAEKITLRLDRILPIFSQTRPSDGHPGWTSLASNSQSCPWWRRRTSSTSNGGRKKLEIGPVGSFFEFVPKRNRKRWRKRSRHKQGWSRIPRLLAFVPLDHRVCLWCKTA